MKVCINVNKFNNNVNISEFPGNEVRNVALHKYFRIKMYISRIYIIYKHEVYWDQIQSRKLEFVNIQSYTTDVWNFSVVLI